MNTSTGSADLNFKEENQANLNSCISTRTECKNQSVKIHIINKFKHNLHLLRSFFVYVWFLLLSYFCETSFEWRHKAWVSFVLCFALQPLKIFSLYLSLIWFHGFSPDCRLGVPAFSL